MGTIILSSVFLSILQSILFFNQSVGISITLFMISLIMIFVYILNQKGKIKNKKALFLSIPILLLCFTYFIFSNGFFGFINVIAILALTISMFIWAVDGELKLNIKKYCNVLFSSLNFEFVEEFVNCIRRFLKVSDNINKDSTREKVKVVLKSIFLGLPVIILVIYLLSAADENFANIFTSVTNFFYGLIYYDNDIELIIRICIIIVSILFFVGTITNLVDENSSFNVLYKDDELIPKKSIIKELTTYNVINIILSVLYFVFVIIQILNISNPGISTAKEYSVNAREGFFQLLIVTFINFVMIVLSTRKQTENIQEKKFSKYINLLLVVFTILLVIISFQKMKLYENNFGLTYLRILVYWALITEIIILIPTTAYIINNKLNLYPIILVIFTVSYVILNYINVDKMILKSNIDIYKEKSRIDMLYLVENTGNDASKEIAEIYKIIQNDKKKLSTVDYEIYTNLLNEHVANLNNAIYINQRNDFRSLNISESNARERFKEINIKEVEENKNYKDVYEY